jgi:hypothetical protein
MPAVKNVGEPCAGEPHARIEVAAGGIWAQSAMPCERWRLPPTLHKRSGLGGDVEAAWGAAGADGDGDGFEEAGGDESGRAAVEVEERVGGLASVDAVLVAESDDGVGESCSLLWGVGLLGDGGERVPAPVGVVAFDRFAEAAEVGADQFGELDLQGEVGAGEVHEALPEMVERAVGEAGEVGDRVPGELGDVGAGELVFGGSALLAAAAFGLAA